MTGVKHELNLLFELYVAPFGRGILASCFSLEFIIMSSQYVAVPALEGMACIHVFILQSV